MGTDPLYIKLIDAIYKNPKFAVRANGKQSESPYLFLFVHSTMMNEADELVQQQMVTPPMGPQRSQTPLTAGLRR